MYYPSHTSRYQTLFERCSAPSCESRGWFRLTSLHSTKSSQLALREAGFLTRLSSQNVIKLEGFIEDLSENRVWLVFLWADNGNLKDFIASEEWEIPERIWLVG